jgi:hypothetical protein
MIDEQDEQDVQEFHDLTRRRDHAQDHAEQLGNERARVVARMHARGRPMKTLGVYLNLSTPRVHQLIDKARRLDQQTAQETP